jgi:hypothetical protein
MKKLIKLILEDYTQNLASNKKNVNDLLNSGWIKIDLEDGEYIENVLHLTNDDGLNFIKNNLGKIQISAFNKGKIGKMGNKLLILSGILNKSFNGDAGTVVGVDGVRYYNPKNVLQNGMYNELIVVPKKINKIIDISELKGDVVANNHKI